MPEVMGRVEKVKAMRLGSRKGPTRALADTPTVFTEMRQPTKDYLAIPEVSSESRKYIPIGFVSNSVIASNKLYTLSEPTVYQFAVLSSAMHMAWRGLPVRALPADFKPAGIEKKHPPERGSRLR
jgi:hypothetical protein